MDLSIVIVSWNVREKLEENLRAIFQSKGDFNFEVFVVDNNSHDGSAQMVKDKFPQVNLVVNEANEGFARANNKAIRKSKGDFVLLLNPDMWVFPDTLFSVVSWMRDNRQASVVGCHLLTRKSNTVNHIRRFPRFLDQVSIIFKIPHVLPFVLNKYLVSKFDYSREQKVDSIRGSFFTIRREMIEKIGGLDERYFIWFEEVDYCRQVYKAGGEVWYTPVAQCLDYVGQSFRQVERMKAQKYFSDSMIKYFQKWHPDWQYRIIKNSWAIVMKTAYVFGKIFRPKKS